MPFLRLLISSLVLLLAVFAVTARIIVSLLVLNLLACVGILLLSAPSCISWVGQARNLAPCRLVPRIVIPSVYPSLPSISAIASSMLFLLMMHGMLLIPTGTLIDSVPDDEQSQDLVEDPGPDFLISPPNDNLHPSVGEGLPDACGTATERDEGSLSRLPSDVISVH
jgi:hypothetical protein